MPAQSLQLSPTLCDHLDCSLPGSAVHGILQARILEWVSISYTRGSSRPRDWTLITCVPCIADRFFSPGDFPSRSDGKETACNAGDPGSIPGSGRSPGEGNGDPLQYSCLENPMDRGAGDYSPWGHKESDTTEWLTLSLSLPLSHWGSPSLCLGIMLKLRQWSLSRRSK